MSYTQEQFNADWPDARLDAMKNAGDTLADATVNAVLAAGDRAQVNAVLGKLHQPDQWPANTPTELQDYLRTSEQLPGWADPVLMARAQDFLTRHALAYNLSLIFLSLPILSGWQVGAAQTLTLTGQLTKHFTRRVTETLRFVLDVTEQNGMSATGRGIATTQKVRLMHATVRHFAHGSKCPDGSNYWNPQWGQAINQEALTATMLAFSTLCLEGMRKLDVNVSEQDDVAVLHLWKVIGHILGVETANMPASVQEARLLWARCVQRNFGKTHAAVALTHANMELLRAVEPHESVLVALVAGADAAMMRYLMGRKMAEIIGVPPAGWIQRAVDWVRRVVLGHGEDAIARNKLVRAMIIKHGEQLMEAVQSYFSKETHSRPFAMPSEQSARAGLAAACKMNKADAQA